MKLALRIVGVLLLASALIIVVASYMNDAQEIGFMTRKNAPAAKEITPEVKTVSSPQVIIEAPDPSLPTKPYVALVEIQVGEVIYQVGDELMLPDDVAAPLVAEAAIEAETEHDRETQAAPSSGLPSVEDLDAAVGDHEAAEATSGANAEIGDVPAAREKYFAINFAKEHGFSDADATALVDRYGAESVLKDIEKWKPDPNERKLTEEEERAISVVIQAGYPRKSAISIVDEHGAAKILASEAERAAKKTGVCRVMTPVRFNGKHYHPGDNIVLTGKQAEQLVAAKAVRYLTDEERTAAEKNREA